MAMAHFIRVGYATGGGSTTYTVYDYDDFHDHDIAGVPAFS